MPRRRTYNARGKGLINWIKEKASKVHNWMKENKPISKILDIPIIGSAIKSTPIGIPAWGISKLAGYGRRKPGPKPRKRRINYRKRKHVTKYMWSKK